MSSVLLQTCPQCQKEFCVEERGSDDLHCMACWSIIQVTAGQRLTDEPTPFLKWVGGKRQLLSQMEPYFPKQINRYYEPFVGGGAVFFHLWDRIETAYLSDMDADLIDAYQCVRNRCDELLVELMQWQLQNCEAFFYRMRQKNLRSQLERAARLCYVSKTAFNGLIRRNQSGKLNSPWGKYKSPKIYNPDVFRVSSEALQKAEIFQASFECLLAADIGPGDFVYFDPPYYLENGFTSYTDQAFGLEQQQRLAEVFRQLSDRGAWCMLSNSDCPEMRLLYQDFAVHEVSARRSVNSRGSGRGPVTELLICNYSGSKPRLFNSIAPDL